MNIQGNKIFALVMLTIFAAIEQTIADSFVPKPPGLHGGYTITQLLNGKWLGAGGEKGNGSNADCAKARLYDPQTDIWTDTGSMTSKRIYHTATLLSDGRVLVAGGESGGDNTELSSAEIYDPATGTWTATGSMNTPRKGGPALISLADGRALITGGMPDSQTTDAHFHVLATAEI